MSIRVVICDDQEVVCEGLRVILGTVDEIDVVGVAHTGAEALSLVAQLMPDVVLMDLKMPVLNGVQTTKQLRALFPQVQVLVLTTYDEDEWVFDAIRAGARGYLLKDTPREGLINAIKATAAGSTVIDPNVAGKLFEYVAGRPSAEAPAPPLLPRPTPGGGVEGLSEREVDVLRLIAQGLNNLAIAQQLHLSEGTVRNYTSTILLKLGVADRTQAALVAIRLGVVDPFAGE